MGKKNIAKAKKLISGATSMLFSPSILTMNCLVAIKEGRIQDCVNYWFKGRKEIQMKSACISSKFVNELDKIMMLLKNQQ